MFLCLLAVAASGLSNLNLPRQSKILDHSSVLEKARLSEVIHLRYDLGDTTWPGWSQEDIPLIVYNEQYAFLIGLPNPSFGWTKVPGLEARGGPWEEVPDDTFEGQPYYRTPITDPLKTPEGFTVKVGDHWVATFQTREFSQVDFYRGFRRDLPPIISNLVPVRLVWTLLMGKTDAYIAALEHKSFHAYEGILAEGRLAAAENMYPVAKNYPFDAMEEPWKKEMDVLVRAVNANSNIEASNLAREFLQLRASRRTLLSPEEVELERLREWEEGLAKYAELEITRQAAISDGYRSVDAMAQDKDFHYFQGLQKFWSEQLTEAKNTQGRSGDTRFYYSGFAIAVLLDRLMPAWKPLALPGGKYLDELLQEVVK